MQVLQDVVVFRRKTFAAVRNLFRPVDAGITTFAGSSPEAISEIEGLIHRHSGRLASPLRFPGELEMTFRRNTSCARARRMWRDGLLTIAVWFACLAADFYFVKDPLWLTVVAKIATTLPFALLSNEIVRRNFPCLLREGSVAVAIVIMQVVSGLSLLPLGDVGYAYAQFACIVCASFAVLVMRLRFAYGIFVVSTTVVEALYLLLRSTSVSLATRSFGFSIAAMTAGILMASAYLLENEERLIFLLRAREEHRNTTLALANSDLERSSQTDFLTGLLNRRALMNELASSWPQNERRAQEVSAVLLDIDHFKKVNDTHGHPYGDLVIARVAALLQTALRCKSDMAVRYGGEEFLILLPNTPMESALVVAERIRSLVETAGAPPCNGTEGASASRLTVSCGVSSCFPSNKTAEELFEAADRALYQAKERGRNRVEYQRCGDDEVEDAYLGATVDTLLLASYRNEASTTALGPTMSIN